MAQTSRPSDAKSHGKEKGLFLAALGIVYGDIGTSPLYAMRECFSGPHHLEVSPATVLGILSLVFWSLVLIVSIKYLVFILRADNQGEGGMLALFSLVTDATRGKPKLVRTLTILAICGASLIYADACITPAISVLSAVEGLQKIAPPLAPLVLPIAAGIVIFLFAFQAVGTAGVGRVFGPVMLVWFSALGLMGLFSTLQSTEVLAAINPAYAWGFLTENGVHSLRFMGAVFLVVTGSEALYADMGHLGPKPLRLGWATVVFPGLLFNYFGQGAALLRDPAKAPTLFFELVPPFLLIPLVILSCLATVIASQAMISGAFSLTRQAVQLGISPRLEIRQTSSHTIGQVYLPVVNWMLLLAVLALLFVFQTSSALAGAYGVAVATAMTMTSVLFYFVARYRWKWPAWICLGLLVFFLIPDLVFLLANLMKIAHGGWFPLVIASVVGLLLTTWRSGRQILRDKLSREGLPMELFLEEVGRLQPHRVAGTAVFLTGNPNGVPVTLLHNYKHNKVLHERILLLNVKNETLPRVEETGRLETKSLGQGFHVVTVRYGFFESPHIPNALKELQMADFEYDPLKITYFLGRETLVLTDRKIPWFPRWRKQLFHAMSRNAQDATRFFDIPPNRVIELGVQIEL